MPKLISIRPMKRAAGLAIACLLASAVASPAFSADMLNQDTYEDEAFTRVEFGTGWYIRGDIGSGIATATATTNFTESDSNELGTPISASLGAGYTFSEGIRGEFMLNQFNNMEFAERYQRATCGAGVTGDCYASVNATINSTSAVANAYFDFNKYFGIRPYVGAGLGFAYTTYDDLQTREICEGQVAADCGGAGAGANQTSSANFETQSAFAVTANAMVGGSYDLSKNLKLDVGYRYTYLGSMDVATVGSNPGISENMNVESTHLHEIRAGLRYEIW